MMMTRPEYKQAVLERWPHLASYVREASFPQLLTYTIYKLFMEQDITSDLVKKTHRRVAQRKLKHVSKPLKVQMAKLIDRTRWPVLVTYSDEGQGHTGYVYKCSGWTPTKKSKNPFYTDQEGKRVSSYANGITGCRSILFGGYTTIQRWEHWACKPGTAFDFMSIFGWRRVPVIGKYWASGNPAYRYEKVQ